MIFDWDEHNEDHIAKHNVAPYEAEEVFFDPKRLQLPAYNTPKEKRYAYLDATEDDRVLVVIFTVRLEKIRIITAMDADQRQRRSYRRQKG